jgi:hypothetical protein
MALDISNSSSWDFPVREMPLPHPTNQGQTIDGLKAIMNANTDEVLHVAGSGYTVLHNSHVVDALSASIKSANVSSDCQFSVKTADGGKKLVCEVLYPDVTIEPKKGDFTQFRVRAYNSYDGKWPFSEECDGLRCFCDNGMVSPMMIAAQRLRHTNSINIEGVTNRIVQNFELFQTQSDLWARMMKTKVDKSACLQFFKTRVINNQGKATKESYSLKQFARLSDQLDYEFQLHGPTQWALYNCLTFWSTHTGEYANPAVTTRTREKQVREAMKSGAWNQLELA